jgi:hypothetical protein
MREDLNVPEMPEDFLRPADESGRCILDLGHGAPVMEISNEDAASILGAMFLAFFADDGVEVEFEANVLVEGEEDA